MKNSQAKVGVRVRCKFKSDCIENNIFYDKVGTIEKIESNMIYEIKLYIKWDNQSINKGGFWAGTRYFELLDDGLICKKINK